MKKLINFVIGSLLAIVVVIGLTTGSANALEVLEQSNVSCKIANPVMVALGNEDQAQSSNSCSSIVCDPDPEKQYYPNPSECTSFCQCSNGVPYYQPCPEGLHFNPTLNVCDWPADAGCQVSDK